MPSSRLSISPENEAIRFGPRLGLPPATLERGKGATPMPEALIALLWLIPLALALLFMLWAFWNLCRASYRP